MKIGPFIERLKTTKDTVRHYEHLGLLAPTWDGRFKDYTEKEINDFEAIKEMQALGLALTDIQTLFQVKRNQGCGSAELLTSVQHSLQVILGTLDQKEQEIHKQREATLTLIKALEEISSNI
ncbi:DNA-binding transcriptional MerR regulator [Pullulanibacillus pueri]|uniref:HTH merR-type domain-containing protein n=1 Tax=Pullulanibacillus pueri TaxID=1437324 RepID=A0A8J3EN60_9BACL|nr:MerR family transcriptional regulator [Pullulanibacillus pueri]MBM7683193.1 DNA-binding transcriptional MerR regulator [Pullulanibacillus pueri]GGH85612.1 hypothetical protein GCM10007096_31410 [Pullulanibacillus pueri]